MECTLKGFSGRKSANAHVVKAGKLEIYFSYETPIAFRDADGTLVVSENVWGSTTGRHINLVDSAHGARVPAEEFEERLQAYLRGVFGEVE
jgi:hypothetical protein